MKEPLLTRIKSWRPGHALAFVWPHTMASRVRVQAGSVAVRRFSYHSVLLTVWLTLFVGYVIDRALAALSRIVLFGTVPEIVIEFVEFLSVIDGAIYCAILFLALRFVFADHKLRGIPRKRTRQILCLYVAINFVLYIWIKALA